VAVLDFNAELYRQTRSDEAIKRLWLKLRDWGNALWFGYDHSVFFKVLFPYSFSSLSDAEQKVANSLYVCCEAWAEAIMNVEAPVVGISVCAANLLPGLLLSMIVKRRDSGKVVIFGGPECTRWNRARFIAHTGWADAVVMGEGEATLSELIRSVRECGKVRGCPGALVRSNGEIVDGGTRPLLGDIDDLPNLDYAGFDLNGYWMHSTFGLDMGRGCLGRCTFCEDWKVWKCYRARDPARIVDEIEDLVNRYGARFFCFSSCLVNGNPDHLSRFCDLLIEKKLGIYWSGNARAVSMEPGLMDKMRASGCFHLSYGLESASPKVLRSMRKGYRVEEMGEVLVETHKRGIDILAMWIVGYPTETEEDFRETLEFIRRYGECMTVIQFAPCNIVPGSYLYDHHGDYGVELPPYDRNFPQEVRYCCDHFFPHEYAHTPYWWTRGGMNTFEVRVDRLNRARALADSVGVKEFVPDPILREPMAS
jgi:radical SAM superfamily enzyme YgiQ (UPF0313 family)